MTFPTGWKYRATVEIDATSSGMAANLTNFPVPIGGDSVLPEEMFYGPNRAKFDFSDVRFSANPDGSSPLNFELEIKGELFYRFWVRVPTLYYNQKTTIYVWWGNYSATAPAASDASFGSYGVWDSNYRHVYHTKNLVDSTVNQKAGQSFDGTYVTGPFYQAMDFEADNSNEFDLPELGGGSESQISLEFYMKKESNPSTGNLFSIFSCDSYPSNGLHVEITDSGAMRFAVNGNNPGSIDSSAIANGTRYHFLVTYNASTRALKIYRNGVSFLDTTFSTTAVNINLALGFCIGALYDGGFQRYFDGELAEFRVSKTVRSIDWAKATYYLTENHQTTDPRSLKVLSSNIREWDTVFPSGWRRRCQINYSGTYIDANISNFPVLVTQDTLPSEIWSGDYHCDPEGKDIRFSSDSAGSSPIPYEIEHWDWAAHVCKIWVKLPTALDAGGSFYVWYRKGRQLHPAPEQTSFGSTKVWTVYEAVYHLNETSGKAIDSTGRHHGTFQGTSFPAQVDGKVYKGQDFEYNNGNYIDIPDESSFDFTPNATIEAWVKRESWSTEWQALVTKGDSAWRLHREGTGNKAGFHCTGCTPSSAVSTSDINAGTWYHIVGNVSNQKIEIFVNGVEEASVTITSGVLATNNAAVMIGNNSEQSGRKWDGVLDEVRISGQDLPDAFIKANYYFVNDPAGNLTEQTPVAVGHSFPTDWSTKIHLKTLGTYIDSNLTDYVAIVTEKQVPSSFWSSCKQFGGDIRASTNADGTGRLPIRLEYFDKDEQKFTLFVKMNVSDIGGDNLYLWWGTDEDDELPFDDTTYGDEAVYDSNYILVDNQDELNDKPGTNDRTSYHHDFLKHGLMPYQTVTAKLAKYAQDFIQSRSDYFERADDSDFNFGTGDFTIHFWIQFKGGSGTQQIICKRVNGGGNYELQKTSSGVLRWYIADSGGENWQESTTALSNGVWYHVIFKRTSGVAKLIINNASEASGSANRNVSSTGTINIGRDGPGNNEFMDAILDELRISKVARSDAYCKIDYYSQNNSWNLWSFAIVVSAGISSQEALGTPTILRGNVNVAPTGIASAETLGTPTILRGNVNVAPSGIVSAEAFGIAKINMQVLPVSISSQEALGIPNVGWLLKNVGNIPTQESFGTPTILRGNVNVAPTGIASAEAFGTPTVLRGNVNVAPSGIASAQVFGTPTILRGNVNVAPSGIVSAEAFGIAKINMQVLPVSISSQEALGNPTILRGNVNVAPSSIPSGAAFGTPKMGIQLWNIPGIISLEILGIPSISVGVAIIYPSGIISGAIFGIPSIIPGPIGISVPSIPSGESLGIPSVVQTIHPTGAPSQESVGSPDLSVGTTYINPTGISTQEAIGTTTQVSQGQVVIVPNGTITAEAFGTPSISTGNVIVSPIGISSNENFGTATIVPGNVQIQANGIQPGENVSQPALLPGSVPVAPQAIPGQAQVGIPIILTGNIAILAEGIASTAQVGIPALSGAVWNITQVGKIPSQEFVSFPHVSPTFKQIGPIGIASAETFGNTRLNMSISLLGIPSAEVFGEPVLSEGGIVISIPSIISGELFGNTIIRNLWVLNPDGIPSAESVQSILVTRFVRSLFQQDVETDLDEIFFHNAPEFAEQIQYIHQDGVIENFMGIFDNEYAAVDVEAGAQIMSSTPVVWMHTSKFRHNPTKGDKVIVRGVRFQVTDNQPDGTGVTMLFLHRESVK